MRRLHLTLETADGTRARHAIADHFPFTLGRQLDNDLPIPFTSISGRHLSIDVLGEQILVTDLGSTNGTFIGTHRLSSHHPTVVSVQNPLRLGDLTLTLQLVESDGDAFTMAQSSTSLHEIVHTALDQSDQAQLHAFFEILSGPGSGRRYTLNRPTRYLLGSGDQVALPLPDPSIAAEAASVYIEDAVYFVEPLGGSTLLLDQTPITEPTALISGARIQVGSCELVFVDPLEELVEPLAPPAPMHRPTVKLADPDTDDLLATPPPIDEAPEATPNPPRDADVDAPSPDPSPAPPAPPRRRAPMEYALLGAALLLFGLTGAILWAFL
ncbi:FHA domain-containing protein [Lujinxingia vulgaris]|uniref:FHA domain-containing protein n=1 Tax=Lujinxingia vulgaris TaxID=2600176 RepID=A0A5C6XCE0_9DELT|nr:FHA domain-containing protein [Lujinxingia vulgaris]TXD38118.1 FHA domain-containing protein [Lujinxingia vulgaris]